MTWGKKKRQQKIDSRESGEGEDTETAELSEMGTSQEDRSVPGHDPFKQGGDRSFADPYTTPAPTGYPRVVRDDGTHRGSSRFDPAANPEASPLSQEQRRYQMEGASMPLYRKQEHSEGPDFPSRGPRASEDYPKVQATTPATDAVQPAAVTDALAVLVDGFSIGRREFPPTPSRPVADRRNKPYRPDTVVDGWIADGIVIAGASLRGQEHRFHQVERQDDLALYRHPESGIVTVAVADGVSNAPESHLGASVAVRQAVMVAESLPHGEIDNWSIPFEHASYAIQQRASELPGAELQSDKLSWAMTHMATTLVVAQVFPPSSADGTLMVKYAAIGDSGVWILQPDGSWLAGTSVKRTENDLTSNRVQPLPIKPHVVQVELIRLDPGAVLFVGSDGFGDPLDTGNGPVGQMFAQLYGSGNPSPTLLALALDFRRETYGDDRTVVAIRADF